MKSNYFIFREANSLEELENLLRLRYKIYRESRLHVFLRENEYNIDIDYYDLKSHHFGLFNNNNEPVGYLRIVEVNDNPDKEKINQIANKFPEIASKIKSPIKETFPMMTYFPNTINIQSFYKAIRVKGENIVEVSRLSIDPVYRLRGLAMHIAESAMAFGFYCHNVHHAILTCSPLHKRIYQRFGFKQLPGTTEQTIKGVQRFCLIGSVKNIPNILSKRIMNMAEIFYKTGQICYNPSDRESFFIPSNAHNEIISLANAA